MKKNIALYFDNTKTIKENAKLIGVSERAIVGYMSKNNISSFDNNFNNRLTQIIKAKKQLEKENIKPTIKQLTLYLRWSNKTVIKYQKIINESVDSGSKILPYITPQYTQIIKSTNHDQISILKDIIKLYIPKKEFDCDLTYSQGVFYKKQIKPPAFKFDKYPLNDTIQPLENIEQINDNSFESVVCDPPFLIDYRPLGANKENNIMVSRFSHFCNIKELYEAYSYLINQTYRVLDKNGILVFKTMPTSRGGKPIDVPFYVKNVCYNMGFSFEDEFVLLPKNKIYNRRHHSQKHSWKWHSYFLVFRKTK